MKLKLNRRKKYPTAVGLLLATATPGFALFGVGDIVFSIRQATQASSRRQQPPSTSSRPSIIPSHPLFVQAAVADDS